MYKYFLSGFEISPVEQCLPGGECRNRQSSGLIQPQTIGYPCHPVLMGQRILRIASLSALTVVGGGKDSITRFELCDAITNGCDDTRGIKAIT